MTLHSFKVDIVDEKKIFNEKRFNKFMRNLVLFSVLGILTVAFLIGHIVTILIPIISIVLGVVIFILTLDFCTENTENILLVEKIVKLWFLWIPLFILGVFLLKFLNFM